MTTTHIPELMYISAVSVLSFVRDKPSRLFLRLALEVLSLFR